MRQQIGAANLANGGQVPILPPLSQDSVFNVRGMRPDEEAALGLRVLVMRVWPRGISWAHVDLWLPDAGPSLELLKAYQGGECDWATFAARYTFEQLFDWRHAGYYKVSAGKKGVRASEVAPLQQLRALRRQHGQVTVMCHERQPDPCHRHVLVQIADEVLVGDRVLHPGTDTSGVVTIREEDGHILLQPDGEADALPKRYHVSEIQLL
jgi:uncharacterized protein YeaO (DUF488 family)